MITLERGDSLVCLSYPDSKHPETGAITVAVPEPLQMGKLLLACSTPCSEDDHQDDLSALVAEVKHATTGIRKPERRSLIPSMHEGNSVEACLALTPPFASQRRKLDQEDQRKTGNRHDSSSGKAAKGCE